MNPVSVGLDLLLVTLLITALAVGVRLNGRLQALRDGHAAFAKSVSELDGAAARAEAGLCALRAATVEAHDQLLTRIETARSLSTRLERATAEAETAVLRAERAAAAAPSPRSAPRSTPPQTAPAPDPSREPPVGSARGLGPLRTAGPTLPRVPEPAPERAAAAPSLPPVDGEGPLARFVARRTGARP